MNINIQKFNEVAKAAKAKTNNKRWQNAIDAAVAGVTSGWWIATELADGVMVTTETGHTYHANGSCQCKAFELGQPCKHRALARLIDLYNETAPVAVSLAAETAEVYCSCCGAPSGVEYDTCPSCGVEGEWMTEEEFFDDEVAASPRSNLIAVRHQGRAVHFKSRDPAAAGSTHRGECAIPLQLGFVDSSRRIR